MLLKIRKTLRGFCSAAFTATALRKDPLPQKTWQHLIEMLVDPVLRLPEADGEFFIDPRSDNFARLVAYGIYEPEIMAVTRSWLVEGRDAVDIGANIGFFTCLLSRGCGSGRVLACEPTQNAQALLRRNIERNKLTNVSLFEGAVAEKVGTVEFSSVDGKEEYSSMGRISHQLVNHMQRKIVVVPTKPLDLLVAENDLKPCLLKIDVEGAEMLVLRGAEKTLTNFRPVIVSELSDELLIDKGSSKSEVFAFLRSHNYVVRSPYRDCEIDAKTRENEILAIPTERC